MAANSVDTELLPIWRERLERGGALPSEEALAAALGASRPAIREALIRMEADGLVRRHHGAGTFPNPAALDIRVRLDRAADFSDRLAAAGYRVDVDLISAEVVGADDVDDGVATRLQLNPADRLLRTVKRWRADGTVAVVATDHVPLHRRADPAAVVTRGAQTVLLLSAEIGVGRADWLCTWPTAVELPASAADLLEYTAGRAVLRIDQVGVERHGRKVFHATEYHRPGVLEHGLIRTVSG